VNEMTLPLRAT